MHSSIKILFIILILYPYLIKDPKILNEFIVWNVGQGQWTTWVRESTCIHFDVGGDNIPWDAILKKCRGKNNIINFSHKDMDHTIGAYPLFKKLSKTTCLLTTITTPPYPEKLNEIPKCSFKNENLQTQITTLQLMDNENSIFKMADPPTELSPKDFNFHSHVYFVKNFIIPGDSTKKAEKYWVPQIKNKLNYTKLVLGHHGSKTSTSPLLMNTFSSLTQCISSAKKSKYGHPHEQTLLLLKQKKCPHLNTEIWGHIHFINF